MDRIEWSKNMLKDRVFMTGVTSMGVFGIKQTDDNFEVILPSLHIIERDTLEEAKTACEKLYEKALLNEIEKRFHIS